MKLLVEQQNQQAEVSANRRTCLDPVQWGREHHTQYLEHHHSYPLHSVSIDAVAAMSVWNA